MDETYLRDLCAFLTDHEPAIGPWTRPLLSPQHGDLRRRTFFSIEPWKVYPAAERSGMPIPPSRGDDERMQAAAEDNALAAVLLTHAQMSTDQHAQRHKAGAADLGTVLGSVPREKMGKTTADTLIRYASAHQQDMWTRILHHLRHSPVRQVDLRTVAALGYAVPGGEQRLIANPTGHYPHRPDPSKGYWVPVLDFVQSFYRAYESPVVNER
ncbi:hypothetical protein ABZ897_53955 [Nonomuraea sp. NPDC046802]|uniref:hypothetical protein n=1 Tax=Nonomuraea sp. NPDC046802 TaxID=3154919 RepID=UPI0033E2184F